MGYPEELPEGSKKFFCEEHEIYYMQNAGGHWLCPVCLIEEKLDL